MVRLLVLSVSLAIPATPAAAGDDALSIIRRAFQSDEANQRLARLYTFHERIEKRFLNKKGETRDEESRTWDVTLLDGSPYKRLIAKNDQPLSRKQEAKQQRKLQESLARMRAETPKQRTRRLREIRKKREEDRKFVREITRAFDFRLIGKEEISGVSTYVISATPRPDYQPAFRKAGVLKKVCGTLWISQNDYGWVKAEVTTIQGFSWGLFLFKLNQGAKIRFAQRRVNNEVWLMDNWSVQWRGRAGLLISFHGEFTGSYRNFRKFTTDSSVTYSGPVR